MAVTVPSITCVPPEVVTRYHVAVPATVAVVAEGKVGDKVTEPPNVPVADGANGVPQVKATNAVVAVPPVVG